MHNPLTAPTAPEAAAALMQARTNLAYALIQARTNLADRADRAAAALDLPHAERVAYQSKVTELRQIVTVLEQAYQLTLSNPSVERICIPASELQAGDRFAFYRTTQDEVVRVVPSPHAPSDVLVVCAVKPNAFRITGTHGVFLNAAQLLNVDRPNR